VDLSHNLYKYDHIIPIIDDSKMKEICTVKKFIPAISFYSGDSGFFLKGPAARPIQVEIC